MGTKIGLIGKKFGRLEVLKEAGSKSKQVLWECTCECGNVIFVIGCDLRRGHTKSCGCLKRDLSIKRATKHRMYGTPTYKSWSQMIQRCNNKKNTAYKNYGKRGIFVCEEWLEFKNFFEDMGERPKRLTIERRNNNLGYFKENCCWATRTTQNRNQRIRKDNKTGISVVGWHKRQKKYYAMISVDSTKIHLGSFVGLEEARQARQQAEQRYWGKTNANL